MILAPVSGVRAHSRTTAPVESLGVIVEEALGAVFAPSRLYEILEESLRTAELPTIPERPTALRVFIEGALFSTLARHLDVADALEIIGQIRSALELALSTLPDERPTSEVRERITLPAPPARIIVVTNASLVVFLLSDILGDGVDVVPVSNSADLHDRVRRFRGAPLLLVIDRKHPCVDASVCETLADELDSRSTVVWWAGDAQEQRLVASQLEGGPTLVPCDPEVRLADLGHICRQLTESPS